MNDETTGWHWFGDGDLGPSRESDPRAASQDIARAAARCLSGPEGDRVIAHLRQLTGNRVLTPDCSDRVLRHLEGQRFLVAYLVALVKRGLGDG